MASSSFSYVKLDPRAVAEILRGPDGPVARDLFARGSRVVDRAKELAGISRLIDPVARRTYRRPGNLRDHIVKRLVLRDDRVACIVGADVPYALWHHEGTPPHTITAKPGKFLVFYWPKTDQVMYLRSVQHPGTKPNRFLVNALPAAR